MLLSLTLLRQRYDASEAWKETKTIMTTMTTTSHTSHAWSEAKSSQLMTKGGATTSTEEPPLLGRMVAQAVRHCRLVGVPTAAVARRARLPAPQSGTALPERRLLHGDVPVAADPSTGAQLGAAVEERENLAQHVAAAAGP